MLAKKTESFCLLGNIWNSSVGKVHPRQVSIEDLWIPWVRWLRCTQLTIWRGICTMLVPIMGDLTYLRVPKSEGARHDIW